MEIFGSAQAMAVPGAGPGQGGEGQGPQPRPWASGPPGPTSFPRPPHHGPRHQAWLQERNQPFPVQMPLSLFFSCNYVSEG